MALSYRVLCTDYLWSGGRQEATVSSAGAVQQMRRRHESSSQERRVSTLSLYMHLLGNETLTDLVVCCFPGCANTTSHAGTDGHHRSQQANSTALSSQGVLSLVGRQERVHHE